MTPGENWEAIETYRRYARSRGTEFADEVEEALDLMRQREIDAVKYVYMRGSREKISSGVIRSRVLTYAAKNFYSEATVYRMLKDAREILMSIKKERSG